MDIKIFSEILFGVSMFFGHSKSNGTISYVNVRNFPLSKMYRIAGKFGGKNVLAKVDRCEDLVKKIWQMNRSKRS